MTCVCVCRRLCNANIIHTIGSIKRCWRIRVNVPDTVDQGIQRRLFVNAFSRLSSSSFSLFVGFGGMMVHKARDGRFSNRVYVCAY